MSKYEIDEETGEVLLNHSAISAEDVVDRLNDLEAKLAESERKYELSSCPTGGLVDRVRNLEQQLTQCEADRKFEQEKKDMAMKRVSELKQQLAEKDKEIEALKYLCGCPNDINEMVRKVVYRDEQLCKQYDFFQDELKRKDQDKISFALEQLNQTKEEIGNNISPIIFQDSYWLGKQTVLDKIDNQIKQLKEGKWYEWALYKRYWKSEYVGHEDSVTMGTYDIEEIEKSNENKVELIWKQSQQIEKLKDKLQKQAEWIENNKNKAKNCAMQMQNQGKEIQRLKQSNKDLMAVIWKTKNERAKKGREVCKANNEVVQYQKQIRLLNERNNQEKIDLLRDIKNYFCIECEDADGIKTGDWEITKDACDVAEYIDTKLAELTHQHEDKGE